MYRIIACDMDETLLGKDKKVSQRNREAIAAAREAGVKFVPNTGRGFASIQGTLEELGLRNKANEYVISFNGGAITENAGNRPIHAIALPFAKAEELYRRGIDYDVCIHVYTIDRVYAYGLNTGERDFLRGRMAVEETSEKNLDFLKGQDIMKILYENTDDSYLRKIEAETADIADDTDVSFSSNRYIEFNKKGVTKGVGLMKLADILGVKPEETIAIGDNFNDLSMLQAAGLGVGVANAVEGIRKDCDYITEAAYDQDAVAEVIEKFILK
ncbi:MAG: HAD family phosphatase [Selenomonadaceae bacterium]|nr:HAD family phosphatase [Selenomonadaceae bacterium]